MQLSRVERVLQFLNKCGFRKPVIQRPFPNGMSTVDLVSSVCNSGALGALAAENTTSVLLRKDIQRVKNATHAPFAVYFGVGKDSSEEFDAKLRVVLDEKIPIVSFSNGMPPKDAVKELKASHTIVMGTATSCAEGVMLQQGGCDAIIAQGYEAGGSRAAFLQPNRGVGTMALVPALVDEMDQTETPVIACGGIMDGRGVVAAFALGAAAVQMSSAFLVCQESGLSSDGKKYLRSGMSEQSTVVENGERVVEGSDPPLWLGQGCPQLGEGIHSKGASDIISVLGKSSLSVMQEIEEIYQAVVRLRKLEVNKAKKHFSQYD